MVPRSAPWDQQLQVGVCSETGPKDVVAACPSWSGGAQQAVYAWDGDASQFHVGGHGHGDTGLGWWRGPTATCTG